MVADIKGFKIPNPDSGYKISRDNEGSCALRVWNANHATLNSTATYYLTKERAQQLIKDLLEIVLND